MTGSESDRNIWGRLFQSDGAQREKAPLADITRTIGWCKVGADWDLKVVDTVDDVEGFISSFI